MSPKPEPDPDPPAELDRAAVLAALRARIARLDRSGAGAGAAGHIPLCPAIDQALPGGGLARAGLHEVLAADPGAATGFCALLLARSLAGHGGAALWIAAEPDAWPQGLARFGLGPADLVLVHARRPADALWAMEEALRCPGVAGALLVGPSLDLTSARRLQLAAEAGGALGLLLREDADPASTTAALTRWRVASAPGAGDPRWELELLRCRGGKPRHWTTTWRETLERLDLDTAEPQPTRRRA